jgi:hypothetical protein
MLFHSDVRHVNESDHNHWMLFSPQFSSSFQSVVQERFLRRNSTPVDAETGRLVEFVVAEAVVGILHVGDRLLRRSDHAQAVAAQRPAGPAAGAGTSLEINVLKQLSERCSDSMFCIPRIRFFYISFLSN